MSHFVNYQMNVTNEKSLIKALQDLDYTIERDTQINGYRGQKQSVHIAAKIGKQRHIGFNRVDGKYESVADWMYIPGGERERIQQHYAKHEAIDVLADARYTLVSNTMEDGTVVLVGQRS